MDTELFMECEEEELEPWQQVDDSVEEDDVEFMETYGEPVEGSPSPQPAPETPPPRTSPPITPVPKAPSSPVQLVSSTVISTHPTVTRSSSSQPVVAQASPLILTQTAGGTFLLPAAPGTGGRQPILLTTQGFPVQTMMNSRGPLLLNLQSGQTVQPLTLFQSSSGVGQLVRPSMGLSPVLPQGQTIQTGPAGGSAFSTVQLPTTLTIRTSTSGTVNLHMTQVGGAKPLKLTGSPALPSGSANGVSTFSSAAPCSMVSSSLTSDPSRVVMSVDEFYYGTFEGDLSLRRPPPLGTKACSFTCQSCSYQADNNMRLMQHMLQHSQLVDKGGCLEKRFCKYCYRRFSSLTRLQTHQDQVHGPNSSSCMCRICEWAFENEPSFLNHMKTYHKPGEMPYICQVCSYRSSFYSSVLQHFASFHRDSRFLLCVFCLKVTRNPEGYQQHLLKHQVNENFHCNRCRLQFVLLKDKMEHKQETHRSFRRPAQLQGLPPGSKVTIRTYGKLKPPVQSTVSRVFQSPGSIIQPINIKTEFARSALHRNAPRSPRSPTKRPIGSRLHIQRTWTGEDNLLCLECGTDASDLPAHYPTHVHCLLCPYSSCCSRAYAAHMIHHHVRHSKDRSLHKLPPPCVFLLRCSGCDFRPQTADQMADHLLLNPLHYSATCLRKTSGERDIEFCQSREQQTPPDQKQDLPSPSWRSAESWRAPPDHAEAAVPFRQLSGPHHSLPKNSDAIDFFNLMFPTALMELITTETNAHAKISRFLDPSSSSSAWIPVTTKEIKAFIGLVVLMGIQNLPNLAHYWSWSHYDNSYTFYRTMSLSRFSQIAANIRMGSFVTEEHRGTDNSADSLHIFRPMLNMLGGAMWNAYRPNCSLTIDRALLPSLEEENGAAKTGAKAQPQVWLLCDSKSGYCHRFFIQAGQRGGQELGFTVVPELVKDLEDKHHQLYLTSALTSVPLMQKLLDQGVYASSSFPLRSAILPSLLWEEGRLEKPGEFLQRQFGPLLATRWRDTKEMGCLSTNAAAGEADTVWRRSQSKVGELDPIDRPMAFRLLQENMRGVDICKQLLACNPLGGVPQDRHWRSLFWFLINLSIVNAFIVLRESRKENPPAWVQDGLFTQVIFRKRLGNQLAKCAQKYFETMEMATSRQVKTEEEPPPERHRMAKINSVTRRCKVCIRKNMRRETFYGCSACKASLCKEPSCFWEYHGMSPWSKGCIKVGFLKDRISGAIEMDDDVDQSMAPVEDMDFSDDDRLEDLDDAEDTKDFQEALPDDLKHLASNAGSAVASYARPLTASKEREDSMSARQLRIALFALCDSLRAASRFFSTETQLIRSWLKEAKRTLTPCEQDPSVDGVARMVSWVLSMREQQLPITESNLFHKASMLKKKGSFSDAFRISYDWAVNFLLQHRLGPWNVSRVPTLSRALPPCLEAKVRSFREFTQKVVNVHQLPEGAVAAMDELCLFVDFRLFQDRSQRSQALELTGSLPLVTVYLSVLADGTMLPTLILSSRSLGEKTLPESVLLEVVAESLQVEEMLDVWTNKVWLQLMTGPARPRKSMLVLDRHREHLGEQFLTSISGAGTLPAVIPGGCTFRLQPLDVCLKPALQRFLLSRWSKFTAGNPKELEEAPPQQLQTSVTQLLVDWVVEALTHLRTHPHLLKKCFELTALLPGPREEKEAQEETIHQKPEEVQLELIRTLTENLLGSDALDSPDLLDLEDEDDAEEEQQGGGEAEAPEKQQEEEVKEHSQETENQEVQESRTENPTSRVEEGDVEDEKEDKRQEAKTAEESEEEEEKDAEEEKEVREVSKERRETRIVIGEEVGDEWKLTVKSRTETAEDDES